MEVGAKWATKNPSKFVAMCIENNDSYAYINNMFTKTPAALEARSAVDILTAKADKEHAKNVNRIETEYNRILDDLYFGDSADAGKALAAFQLLVESL